MSWFTYIFICYSNHILTSHRAIALTVSREVNVAERSDQRFSNYGTPATDKAYISKP